MDIFLIILFIVSIYGCKISTTNNQYSSRSTTDAVKGIFAIIILLSHSRHYIITPIIETTKLNSISSSFNSCSVSMHLLDLIGQLMVVMFLLYSGYGIMESYKRKGRCYLKTLLKREFLRQSCISI